jgi:hypothetical protein
LLKRKPVVMDVLNLALMKRLARMSVYTWLPRWCGLAGAG